MDELLRLLVEWVEIPSVTGAEGDYADAAARHLQTLGLGVERQDLAPGRFNVLARAGEPEVVLCTHLDTVPPWFGSRVDAEFVHGRGACDAKGPAVAMIAALARLLREGEERVGLLLTAGEELDSAGAALANARLSPPWRPRFTIVGEPTDNRFVRAHKGVFKAELVATGVPGHSSQTNGPSAVHELVRALHRLLQEDWGHHGELGPGSLNVGEIRGGVAPNVVAGSAEASVLVRVVEPVADVESRIRACLSERVRLEKTASCYGLQEFFVPDGRPSECVAFGTDAPYLSRWGEPLLYGPGRISDAHTEHERISKRSLFQAADDYTSTARTLLSLPRTAQVAGGAR